MKRIKFFDENLSGQPGLSPFISPQINWDREIKDYEIAIYTDKLCFKEKQNNLSNYAWIIEPPIINGENYKYIVNESLKFKKVFSYMRHLEKVIPNFVFCPHGGTWLNKKEISLNSNIKNKLTSFIFSDKQWNNYHKIRHRIYESYKNNPYIDFYGSGCNKKIERKNEALSSYMFSIVIENSEENDYFTEKIIDCFLSGVIPIYMGTRNIGSYFNNNGIITLINPEDLEEIIPKLSAEFYNSKLEYIKENFEKAKNYIHPELLINKFIFENE